MIKYLLPLLLVACGGGHNPNYYQDGFASAYNTQCRIRSTLVDPKGVSTDSFQQGQRDGIAYALSTRCGKGRDSR